MKNIWKAVLVLAFAVIGAFAVSSPKTTFVSTHNNSALETNSAESVKQMYLNNCARCHGADGKGDTNKGRELDVPDLTQIKPSLSKSIRTITKGDDDMPAFGSKLNKTQITALARYVRSL